MVPASTPAQRRRCTGPPGDALPFGVPPPIVDDSDRARIARATGLSMQRHGINAHRALDVVFEAAWDNQWWPSVLARELVENRLGRTRRCPRASASSWTRPLSYRGSWIHSNRLSIRDAEAVAVVQGQLP